MMERQKLSERQLEMIKELVPLQQFSKKMEDRFGLQFKLTTMQMCKMTVDEMRHHDAVTSSHYALWKGAQTDYYYALERFVKEMLPEFMQELYDQVNYSL